MPKQAFYSCFSLLDTPAFRESFEFQPSFFMYFSCILCNEKFTLNFGLFSPELYKKICFFASLYLFNMLFCIKMQFFCQHVFPFCILSVFYLYPILSVYGPCPQDTRFGRKVATAGTYVVIISTTRHATKSGDGR